MRGTHADWDAAGSITFTYTTPQQTKPTNQQQQVVKSGDKPHFMHFDLTWFFDLLKIGDYAEGTSVRA